GLQGMVRQPARERLLDRLLVSAAIEARSAERLRLLGAHLPDPELRRFYGRLASAEKGHEELFLRLAARCDGFDARLAEVRGAEARLMRELPFKAGDSLKAARRWRRFPATRASDTFASARGGSPGSGVPRIPRGPASPAGRVRSAPADGG